MSKKLLPFEINHLEKKCASLELEIANLTSQGYQEQELTNHIQRLHEYNEVKDATQIVLGRLAEVERLTTLEIHRRYGLHLDD